MASQPPPRGTDEPYGRLIPGEARPQRLASHPQLRAARIQHLEKSRVFLARALLQDAQLTVLDESFAALDPQTLEQCMQCAFDRARTLLVVAHP